MSNSCGNTAAIPRPPAARPQSARVGVTSSGPLFRPIASSAPHSSTSSTCLPASATFPVQPIVNKLALDYQNFHAIEKEPFFWKADDPQFAPASDIGPKYDPKYTLVRPRVQSANLKRTSAKLGMVKNTPEEQEAIDARALLLNAAAIARFEQDAGKQMEMTKKSQQVLPSPGQAALAAVRDGGGPAVSPRTAAVDPAAAHVAAAPPVAQQQVIADRLDSARRTFSRPGTATTRYAPNVGGHWTDGIVQTGTSFSGHTCLADRTVNTRLPVYSIIKSYQFLLPSPRQVSFSKSERFPSPRSAAGSNSLNSHPHQGSRPTRREAVVMQSRAEDSIRKRPSTTAD